MRLRIPHMNCQLSSNLLVRPWRSSPGQHFDSGRQPHTDCVDDQLVQILVARVRIGQLQGPVPRATAPVSTGSQRHRFGADALTQVGPKSRLGHQVDRRVQQIRDLLFQPALLHQTEWLRHDEQQVDVRAGLILTHRDRSEDPHLGAADFGHELPDLVSATESRS